MPKTRFSVRRNRALRGAGHHDSRATGLYEKHDTEPDDFTRDLSIRLVLVQELPIGSRRKKG